MKKGRGERREEGCRKDKKKCIGFTNKILQMQGTGNF
jgi:hypothetical protein